MPIETPAQPKFVIETTSSQGMTKSDRYFMPEELAHGGLIKDKAKRSTSEAEGEEFLRKMQDLDLYRQALMKDLDDTYVLVGTSSDNVASMIIQVIRGHQIIFCDEEVFFKGRIHNKALHVTIICRENVINHVLVDDESSLNIFPLSTLRQLSLTWGSFNRTKLMGGISMGCKVTHWWW